MSALLTRGPDWQDVRAHEGGTAVLFDELTARTNIGASGTGYQGLLLQPSPSAERVVLLWGRRPGEASFVLHAPSLLGHLSILAGTRHPRIHELHFSMRVPGVLRADATTWQYGANGCERIEGPGLAELLQVAGLPQAQFIDWAFELLGRLEDDGQA